VVFSLQKIPLVLINSLLDAEVFMTSEERDDLVLQRSLINRAVNHLPPLEPDRIKFKSEVARCGTFKKYLLWWTLYKNDKQVTIGYLVSK
jgi:hypothetical protein